MQLRSAAARSSLIAVLLALLVPATAASASHVEVRETDSACADAPEDGFSDTGSEGSAQEEAVDCIAWFGITSGSTATAYEPGERITRGQMARMVAESMRQSLTRFPEPGDGVDHFSDDDSSPFESDIDFVAEYEVVQGTGGSNYSPAEDVTRAQMATFLVNQLRAIGVEVPPASQDYFVDDEESVHEDNINRLAELGLASGRVHLGFQPARPVTRGQMALFVSRDLSLLVEGGYLVTPDEHVDPAADGDHTNAVVADVARAADTFTSSQDDEEHGAERFWYDDNDVFQDPDGGDITLAEFEGLLTGPVGETEADVVDVNYAHAPDEESTFQVVTDNVPPATNAIAVAGDYDNDDDRSDVQIFWDASEQPNVLYDVFRDDEACGAPLVAPEDCEVASDLTDTSVILTDEDDGTWSYYVIASSPSTGSESEPAATNEVTVPAPTNEAGRPVSQLAIRVYEADGDSTTADDGDVWQFVFSEPLAEIENGDSITVADGAGTSEEVRHNPPPFSNDNPDTDPGDAVFSLNSDTTAVGGNSYGPGRVLTVELVDDLGDAVALHYPLTVQYSTGLTDDEGQPVNWEGSGFDRTIEAEVAYQPKMTDADGDLNGTGPDRITVTYNVDVTCDPEDDPELRFTYRRSSNDTNGTTATGITCSGDNTVVLTFDDGVLQPGSTSDTLSYNSGDEPRDGIPSQAGQVEDDWGNPAEHQEPDGQEPAPVGVDV